MQIKGSQSNASSEVEYLKKQRDKMEQEMREMREKMKKMEITEAEALNQLQEEKRKAEHACSSNAFHIPQGTTSTGPAILVNKPSKGHVQLTLASSHDTKLFAITGFTVMEKTGKIVVKGRSSSFGSELLYVYALHSQDLIPEKRNAPCNHGGRVGLLGLVISGIEYLAISCSECRDIKLLDLETMEVIKAYNGENGMMRMCMGEGNTLYVEACNNQVLELDCTHPAFTKRKTFNTTVRGRFKGMCYVPSPHRLLVGTNGKEIVAIDCDTYRRAWKRIEISLSNPRGLFYSKILDAILVAEGRWSKLTVLEPGTLNTRQTLEFPEMGTFRNLYLYGSQLILRRNYFWKRYISFYSIYQKLYQKL